MQCLRVARKASKPEEIGIVLTSKSNPNIMNGIFGGGTDRDKLKKNNSEHISEPTQKKQATKCQHRQKHKYHKWWMTWVWVKIQGLKPGIHGFLMDSDSTVFTLQSNVATDNPPSKNDAPIASCDSRNDPWIGPHRASARNGPEGHGMPIAALQPEGFPLNFHPIRGFSLLQKIFELRFLQLISKLCVQVTARGQGFQTETVQVIRKIRNNPSAVLKLVHLLMLINGFFVILLQDTVCTQEDFQVRGFGKHTIIIYHIPTGRDHAFQNAVL